MEEQKRMQQPTKPEDKKDNEPSSEDEKGDSSTQDEKSVASDSEDHKFACATELLKGLKKLNIKIYLVSEELSVLSQKARFANLFDVAVIGFYHSQHATGNFASILKKPTGVTYIELPKNFVGIKAEIKEKCYEKQVSLVKAAGLKMMKSGYGHHYLFGFEGNGESAPVAPEEKKVAQEVSKEEKKELSPSPLLPKEVKNDVAAVPAEKTEEKAKTAVTAETIIHPEEEQKKQ